MAKKVLVISSAYTGRGHKSITDALCEQFNKLGAEVSVLEAFKLLGNTGVRMSKFYGPLTRTSKEAWGITWQLAQHSPDALNKTIAPLISRKFVKVLEKEKPDVIASVHPMFIGCVLDVLQKKKINIPFVSVYADLVSMSNLWADPRVDYSICYTKEAYDFSIAAGIAKERIKYMSFPVRERFTFGEPMAGSQQYKASRIPTFLIMSGGEGSGNMVLLARMLLNNFNCRVKVLVGRNESLKRKLERTEKERYGDRIEIFGFTDAIEELMLSCDLAFMRGSPNTIMEAINCCLPVVITDALPGQEAGNPAYFEANGLGFFSNKVHHTRDLVQHILADDGKVLHEVKEAQKAFRNPNAAKEIAEFIMTIG